MPDETPTETFELPCGIVDDDGSIVRSFELRPMTGKVRSAVARPEVRKSGPKIIDTVLKGAVKSIGSRPVTEPLLKELLNADRDYIMLMVRKISSGDVIKGVLQCTNSVCAERMELSMNISEMDIIPLEDSDWEMLDSQRVFKISSEEFGLTVVCRYPNGGDQHAVFQRARTNPIEGNYALYARCLKIWEKKGDTPIEGGVGIPFFEALSLPVLDWFEKAFADKQPGVDLAQIVNCEMCGARSPMTLNLTDFLFRTGETESM